MVAPLRVQRVERVYRLSGAIRRIDMTETNQPSAPVCSRCGATMQLVRHIALEELPEFYIFYCARCRYVETIKEERAATDIRIA